VDQDAFNRAFEELRARAHLQDARIACCCDLLAAAKDKLFLALDAIVEEARIEALAMEKRHHPEQGPLPDECDSNVDAPHDPSASARGRAPA
jgi:hypothetical protein